GIVCGLEEPAGPFRLVRGQPGGALEGEACFRVPSTGTSVERCRFERCGDLLVQVGGRRGEVPRAPVGSLFRWSLRKRLVGSAAGAGRGTVVDGRAQQRMPE